MRKTLALAVVAATALGGGAVAVAGSGGEVQETLTGYEETPEALSTPGVGEFRAHIDRGDQQIRYELTFADLESPVTQAHIHFEKRAVSGPIVVWLCGTPSNPGPAGTQMCPAGGGTVTGVIEPDDVGAGAAARGLEAGEFEELVRAIRNGATYVNVHSQGRPSGEIRAQLEDSGRGDDHQH